MAAAALAAALSVPAQAAMSVATFLAKADALKAKGIMALGSSDIKLLQQEMQAVGGQYRADIKAARDAGKTPHSCPPATPQKMKSDELLAHFRAVPPEKRGSTSVKTAFYDLMKKRYPCPAG